MQSLPFLVGRVQLKATFLIEKRKNGVEFVQYIAILPYNDGQRLSHKVAILKIP